MQRRLKYKYSLLVFILLCDSFLLSNISTATAIDKYFIYWSSGNKTVHYVDDINGQAYIQMSIVAPLLYPGCDYSEDACELTFKEIDIRFLPTSFYVYCDNDDEEHIAQMLLPAIIFKKQLCVPVNTFFKSLETLGLFSVEIENNVITLKKNEEPVTVKIPPKKTGQLSEKGELIAPEREEKEEEEPAGEQAPEVTNIPEKSSVTDTSLKSKREPFAVFERDKNYSARKEEEPEPGTLFDAFYSISHFAMEGLNALNNIKEQNTPDELEQKTQKETTPGKKGMKEPAYKNYPPNLYVVPKNLIRKELNSGDSTAPQPENKPKGDSELNYNSSKQKIPPSDLLACSALFAFSSNPQIIEINAVNKSGMTELHFITDKPVTTYQKPDYNGKNLVLRIENVINGVDDFSKIEKIEPISSMKSELIRDILVFRIKLSNELKNVEVHRNGPKELVYVLSYESASKPIESKSVDTVKEDKPVEEVQEKLSDEEDSKEIKAVKKKWALDVIILDPGHGGFDSGTISVNGYKEKDIALDIALKVRDLIREGMPETKVFMTRDDDRFIELSNRTKFANEHKGKLFISIHLNATPKKPSNAKGFETYILRPGRNDDAIRIANFENSVIKFEKPSQNTIKITDEDVILATMAQSAFVKLSELFGRILQSEVPKITHLENRGVNQAGFYVLVGASMPNVLIETAFLSNTEDEAFVTSKNGTAKVAKGIFNAIKKYSEEYEKTGR